jgi:thiosulfate dehydrogenase [quinone] large subunit
MNNNARYAWAVARISLGWIFFWAFIDKLFGLGFATPADNAWLAGGSPTAGYLGFAVSGPFSGLYNSLAGNPVIDWLFMLGLFGVGLGLILGVGMKIASYGGVMMMLLMWSSNLPPANNPILDDHIIYAVLLVGLAAVKAEYTWGLGKWWDSLFSRSAAEKSVRREPLPDASS